LFKVVLKKNCLKTVTIQYLPVDGSPYGTELLNRHHLHTIILKETFLKILFLKTLFFKDTFFLNTLFLKDTF